MLHPPMQLTARSACTRRVATGRRALRVSAAGYGVGSFTPTPPPSAAELPRAAPAVVRERAKAALLGSLLADAATMPLHWEYMQDKIVKRVKREPDNPLSTLMGLLSPTPPEELERLQPEFFDPPGNMFYTYPLGQLSPYGEENAALVRSLAKTGSLRTDDYTADSAREYRAYKGRLNSLSKTFLARLDAGEAGGPAVPGDTQAHSLVRVPAIVARYAGSAICRDAIADAVRVHQSEQAATDYAQALGAILETVVLGAPLADALKWAAFSKDSPLYDGQRKEVSNALAELGNDPRAVVSKMGISCSLPGPFIGPLALCFNNGGDFAKSVRANIFGGGDNCSRAAVVGALCGAQGGMEALPQGWRGKVTGWAELEAAADKIVADAGYV